MAEDQRRGWATRGVGQFRAKQCPICGSTDNGNWTCPTCTELVNVHREMVRNLQGWHSLFEAGDVEDILVAADGRSYCMWDIDRFYGSRYLLAPRMQDAIRLCLYENRYEREAAIEMGVAATNPVSVYATVGLTHLLGRAARSELQGYSIVLDNVNHLPTPQSESQDETSSSASGSAA